MYAIRLRFCFRMLALTESQCRGVPVPWPVRRDPDRVVCAARVLGGGGGGCGRHTHHPIL